MQIGPYGISRIIINCQLVTDRFLKKKIIFWEQDHFCKILLKIFVNKLDLENYFKIKIWIYQNCIFFYREDLIFNSSIFASLKFSWFFWNSINYLGFGQFHLTPWLDFTWIKKKFSHFKSPKVILSQFKSTEGTWTQ